MGASVKSLLLRVVHFNVWKFYLKQLLVEKGWRVGRSTNKIEMVECFLLKLGDEYMRVYYALLFTSYIYGVFYNKKEVICLHFPITDCHKWLGV